MDSEMKHPAPTEPIDVTKVGEVYSGRPGCACGCRGKYYHSSTPHEGYVEGDATDDKMVARVVKLFNANLELVWDVGGGIFQFDLSEKRTYTVYMIGWK